jgi:short subunit fatty acids transporter
MPVLYLSKMFFMKGIQSANQINCGIMLQFAFRQPLNVPLAFVDIADTT